MPKTRLETPITPSRFWAPGLAAPEIIVLLIAAVSIGGIAAFVGPKLLRASTADTERTEITDPVAVGIRDLIESAIDVLSISIEPLTGDTFVVLWGGDPDDKGRINRGEIVVIHHSQARQALSGWICTEPVDVFDGIGEPPVDTRARRVPGAYAASPKFGTEWTQAPDVERRVIGSGVRSFRFERAGGANRTELFRISLTRASPVSDGDIEESDFEARLGAALAAGSR